jgi:hypothetical protein
MKTSFESLCKGFPQEFVTYFQYVRCAKQVLLLVSLPGALWGAYGGWRGGIAAMGVGTAKLAAYHGRETVPAYVCSTTNQ